MQPRHFAHWPAGMPLGLRLEPLRLHDLLERAASRFPDKTATVFQDASLSYRELLARAEALAGHLQVDCGVQTRQAHVARAAGSGVQIGTVPI